MKLKSAITKSGDNSFGLRDIVGYVEYTVMSEDALNELFMIDEVVEAGYSLDPYIIASEPVYCESKSPSRDNY